MGELRSALREATDTVHERLEGLPFFTALHEGTLPRLAVVSYIRSLSVIHGIAERSLAESGVPAIAALGELAGSKASHLAADLDALEAEGMPSIRPAIRHALESANEILREARNPASLVGVLYVLEGSQNGGVVLREAFARCAAIEADRLSYFGAYGSETAVRWKSFVEALDSISLTADETNAATTAAVACMESIERIATALYPFLESDVQHHVTAINFEAGDHIMPQDPLLIALALRAGRKAWEKFPYLELRFGERGRRFTGSDSCWLVALSAMPTDPVTKSLKWLRKVLSTRGIPTIILEGHLREISRELNEHFPDLGEERARFDKFLAELEAERSRIDTSGSVSAIESSFDNRLAECPGVVVPSAAHLIISAWTDERSGIDGALSATVGWFSDAEGFSPEWIAIVNELVASLDQRLEVPC